jgi:polyhydroxyalkanoate synthase
MTASQSEIPPWLAWQQAMVKESLVNLERWASAPRIWDKARRVKKGVTPSEIVYEEDSLRLLHYRAAGSPKYSTPLIFVFALVNRPYILDLKPGRSVVSHFVNRGFDTYLVDWGTPSPADRHLTLDDYINGYLVNVVEHVRERTGSEQVSLLGYCMGGTMTAMFTALHPPRIRNLILLAAGIDFATRDGLLNLWTQPEYFDVDKFVDTFGNCPAEYLQTCFQWLKPVQNLIERPLNFWENVENDEFVEDFLTMSMWLNDNIPVPGEVFREFVKYLYQQNLLVQNRLPVGRHIVDLRRITCPVLNLVARSDDLVPCAQSLPFNDLVASTDRKAITLEAGHIGLAVGGKAQHELWPQACDWLAKRS